MIFSNRKILLRIGMATIALAFSGALASAKDLDLRHIHGRQFRLINGPINRCPEKLGIQTNFSSKEVTVYPMELEWEQVRPKINPVVVMRAVRKKGEPLAVQVVSSSGTSSTYSSVITKQSLESVTTTNLPEDLQVESHARMNFSGVRGENLELMRWSVTNGSLISENLICAYVEALPMKSTQALAR